jgi:hypothetical protein
MRIALGGQRNIRLVCFPAKLNDNAAVELIVFGKEQIPFAGLYHSITDLLPASPLFPPFRKPAIRSSSLASALRQYPRYAFPYVEAVE